jgi:hypothetical protein
MGTAVSVADLGNVLACLDRLGELTTTFATFRKGHSILSTVGLDRFECSTR